MNMGRDKKVNGKIQLHLPRIMVAAPNSGSGKTTVVCGLLQACVNRGLVTNAYKCGPDYIDPMFHRTVLKVQTGNLDAFFSDESMLRYLFAQQYDQQDGKNAIAIVEGVMGYYDGKSLDSMEGSSYDLAKKLELPVILVVNGKGASLSILAQIQGFLHFQTPSMIQGVLLNQIAPSIYDGLKKKIEEILKIPVVGYLPVQRTWNLSSRHLGLVRPDEIMDIQEKVMELADQMEKTVEIDRILQITQKATEFTYEIPMEVEEYGHFATEINAIHNMTEKETVYTHSNLQKKLRIAIAQDEAFCFYYKENRMLLEKAGIELVSFSPLRDAHLPLEVQGLILGGGYPELYAASLGENLSMKESIFQALQNGMPCLAECGGFLYLQETLADESGTVYPMVGFLDGHGTKTEKRDHFGYIQVSMKEKSVLGEAGVLIPGHEFHYWRSDREGTAGKAIKPDGIRSWNCIRVKKNTLAGFPHFYYPGNLGALQSFITACKHYMM